MSFVSNCYTATVYLVIIFQHTVPIPNLVSPTMLRSCSAGSYLLVAIITPPLKEQEPKPFDNGMNPCKE